MMNAKASIIGRISCLTAVISICSVWPAFVSGNDRITRTPSSIDSNHDDRGLQDHGTVHIFFADRTGTYLQAEGRVLAAVTNEYERGRLIINALIKGPKSGLVRTIPSAARLNAFYITQNGRAYVDLSEDVAQNSPGGCRTEVLTVYSIVNSLVLNMPEVESVKILVNGRETSTLAGHIDSRFPFTADMLLIR